MKKLILVLISSLIMTVFIAFNYLLWDRENKIKSFEVINSNKNLSIDSLRLEVDRLTNENREQKNKINEIHDTNQALQFENNKYIQEKSLLEQKLLQKNETIDRLKNQVDIKQFEVIIKEWIENIDKGQYENAFKLQNVQIVDKADFTNLYSFEDYCKNSIKSIKLKSLRLDADNISDARKGEIVFKAVLELRKVENSKDNLFKDGVNEIGFTINYDRIKASWIISNIES